MFRKIVLSTTLLCMFLLLGMTTFATSTYSEGSFVQEDGEWIYYLEDRDFGNLYKVKKEGTFQQKVFDTKACDFVIVGDWIYYIKSNKIYYEGQELYRVRKDGSDNQFVYKHEWSDIDDLEYSNGYITFYAGNMNKMDVKTLEVVDIDEWRHWPADNRNGYLICQSFDYGDDVEKVYLYKLDSGETSEFALEGSLDSFACDDGWLYYSQYASYSKYNIYKMDFKGQNKKMLLEEVDIDLGIQVFDDYLYYSNYVDKVATKWRVSVKGGQPQVYASGTIETIDDFSNIIDEIAYFKNDDYLGVYDMQEKSLKYKEFPSFAYYNATMTPSDVIYLAEDGFIVELSPKLIEMNRYAAAGLRSIDGELHEIDKDSFLYQAGDYVAIRYNFGEDLVVNIKDKTVYGLGHKDSIYGLAGMDTNYLYFYGEKSGDITNKLYRLAIGETSFDNLEHIWDVDDVHIHDGYAVDCRYYGSKTEVYLMNLATLESKRVSGASVFDTFFREGSLYYSSRRNGSIYKYDMASGKLGRVYNQKPWATELVVTDDSIYTFTWKEGNHFVRTDKMGQNKEELSADAFCDILGSNDRYILFAVTKRWASFSPEKNKVRMIGDLTRNFTK